MRLSIAACAPMGDGVRLSMYLYLPKGSGGPCPVLYEQRYASLRSPASRQTYARLAAHGYAVAAQNFRSTQQSKGVYNGYRSLGWVKRPHQQRLDAALVHRRAYRVLKHGCIGDHERLPAFPRRRWSGASSPSVPGPISSTPRECRKAGVTLTSGTLSYWPASASESTATVLNANTTGAGQIGTLDTTVLPNGTCWIKRAGTNTVPVTDNGLESEKVETRWTSPGFSPTPASR